VTAAAAAGGNSVSKGVRGCRALVNSLFELQLTHAMPKMKGYCGHYDEHWLKQITSRERFCLSLTAIADATAAVTTAAALDPSFMLLAHPQFH
jgi:hypothetical protein